MTSVGLEGPKVVRNNGDFAAGDGAGQPFMTRPQSQFLTQQRRLFNVHFSKMHGLGNDFIVVRLPAVFMEELVSVPSLAGGLQPASFHHPDIVLNGGVLGGTGIVTLGDRKRGIGCDQVIVYARRRLHERPATSVAATLFSLGAAVDVGFDATTPLHPQRREELFMWIFNGPTGEEVGMCGNALRCVALHYALTHDDTDTFDPIPQEAVKDGRVPCRGATEEEDIWVGGPRGEVPFYEAGGTMLSSQVTMEVDVRVVLPNKIIPCEIKIPASWVGGFVGDQSGVPRPLPLTAFRRHQLKRSLLLSTSSVCGDDRTGREEVMVNVYMGTPTAGSLAVLYAPSYPIASHSFLGDLGEGVEEGFSRYRARVVKSNRKANRSYLNTKLDIQAAGTRPKSATTVDGAAVNPIPIPIPPSPPVSRRHRRPLDFEFTFNAQEIAAQLQGLVVGTETFEADSADPFDAPDATMAATSNLHPRSRPMNAFAYRTDFFAGYILSQLQVYAKLSREEIAEGGRGESSSEEDRKGVAARYMASAEAAASPSFSRAEAVRAYLNLRDLLFANAIRAVTMVDFGNPHLVILIDFEACRFRELAQIVEMSGRELLKMKADTNAPLEKESIDKLRARMSMLDTSLRRHSITGRFGRAASLWVGGASSTEELLRLLEKEQQDLQFELRVREREQEERLQVIRERYEIPDPSPPSSAATPLELDDGFVRCIGETIERHCPLLFPNGANVEFAFVRHEGDAFYAPSDSRRGSRANGDTERDASVVRMRVWERGAGITEACGSGACAVGVAAFANNRARSQTVVLDGGILKIVVEADEVIGTRVNPDAGRMYGLAEAIDGLDDPAPPLSPVEGRAASPRVERKTLDDLLNDSASSNENDEATSATYPRRHHDKTAHVNRTSATNEEDEQLEANYQPFVVTGVTMAGEAAFVALGSLTLSI